MKNFVIVAQRRAALGDIFRQNQLVAFQFTDLAFIRANHGGAVRFHDPVEKLADLLFHRHGFQLERRFPFFRFLGATIPLIAERGCREDDHITRGRERTDQGFQRAFDFIPCDGLAVAAATMLATQIVRIVAASALRPCGGHGVSAIATGHEPAQREVGVDVLAGRGAGFAREPILNEIEGFQRDQPLMLAFLQRELPAGNLDIARVKRLGQNLVHALIGDQPVPVGREQRGAFKEPLHFGL